LDWLVVADLGLNENHEVIRALPRIARRTLYVDHHLLTAKSMKALQKANVTVRHSIKDCASVLVWDYLREQLPEGAIGLAAYGAVTDPPGTGAPTREVLSKTNRNLNAYEGNLLALALSSRQCTDPLRRRIVEELASLTLPHEMSVVRRLANEQARILMKSQKRLHSRAQVKGRVAIAQAREPAVGLNAELLLAYPDVVASLVYAKAGARPRARISVRGIDDCGQHLGRLMVRIARKLGGQGGGHRLAAGAMVPSSRLKKFIDEFVEEIES
jgi:RecJ-like exonuclease